MTFPEKYNQHKKFFIHIGILILIYLLFHKLFENIILQTVLIEILTYPKSNWINDSILTSIIILILIQFGFRIKRSYKVSLETIISLILTSILYTTYRFPAIYEFLFGDNFPSNYGLLEVYDFPVFKYLDIIYFYLFIQILLVLIVFFKNGLQKKNNDSNSIEGYLFDEPLSKGKTDLLDRENIAEEIALKISNTKSKESSFALGINGEWGSGKTSFIYLIEKHITKENRIIIKFNPWLSHDIQNIAISFFKTLSKELKPFHSGVSGDIIKYAKLLVESSNSNYSPILKTTIDYLSPNSTLQSEFDKINQIFKKLEKQIIIIIDDVDRLDHQEINELLKLIRNSANFANVVFIVAYDRNYIVNSLRKLNSYYPNNYLEKIFQFEIPLPKFESSTITDLIYNSIKPILSENDFKKLFDHKNRSVIFDKELPKFNNYLYTIRDANKYLNLFHLYYSQIKDDVNIIDLLNFCIFLFKYPGVYSKIFTDLKYFFDQAESDKKNNSYNIVLKVESTSDNIKNIYVIKRFLINHYSEVSISYSQIDYVIKILLTLFPSEDKSMPKRKTNFDISSALFVNRYLFLTLLDDNLSLSEFNKARLLEKTLFLKSIEDWIEKKNKYELKDLLIKLNFFDNNNDFDKILSGLFLYGRKTQFELPDSQNDIIQNIIQKTINWFSISNDKPKIKEIFNNLLIKTSAPYDFDISIYFNLIVNNSLGSIFDQSEFVDIQFIVFKEILANSDKLDNDLLLFYQGISAPKGNEKEVFDKVNELFIKNIESKFLVDFLKRTIKQDTNNNHHLGINFRFINSVFSGIEAFEEFLIRQYTPNRKESLKNYLKAYNDFYTKLKDSDLKYIPYHSSLIKPFRGN